MRIAGVLCLCAAVLTMTLGMWALARPRSTDPAQLALRAVAPAQVAAAVLLAAGGAVALAGPPRGALLVLVLCVLGALGTLAAGSWQGARYAARPPTTGCCGGCGCGGADNPAP